MTGRLMTAKEAASKLHISLFTLRKIEKEGLMVPYRTPGGHRRYSEEPGAGAVPRLGGNPPPARRHWTTADAQPSGPGACRYY
jgi:hypothetical protein